MKIIFSWCSLWHWDWMNEWIVISFKLSYKIIQIRAHTFLRHCGNTWLRRQFSWEPPGYYWPVKFFNCNVWHKAIIEQMFNLVRDFPEINFTQQGFKISSWYRPSSFPVISVKPDVVGYRWWRTKAAIFGFPMFHRIDTGITRSPYNHSHDQHEYAGSQECQQTWEIINTVHMIMP